MIRMRPSRWPRIYCARCERSLGGAEETARVRRQAADVQAPPPPTVTEYQLVSRRYGGCGHLNDPTAVVPRRIEYGVGGAIIALSDADAEFEETAVKATPLLQLLGQEFPERSIRLAPGGQR
jgi:hypothetical protein